MTTLTLSDLSREERERLEQARVAGRIGLHRPSDETLFSGGLDPSDSGVIRMLDAFIEGQKERQK